MPHPPPKRERSTWTAAGHTGTIPITRTTTRQLPVGELHSIIVR